MSEASRRVTLSASVLLFTACSTEDRVTPTYASNVASIIHASCTPCHRPGETAPFSLLSYEDSFKKRRQIARVAQRGIMPPWLPTHGDFLDDRSLAESEIAAITQWAEAGAPRGDPAAEPSPPRFTEGWQLGEPDLVVEAPQALEVPAEGPDQFRNLVIPVDVSQVRYVRAVEIRPGNPAVHHAILNVDGTRESRRLDALDDVPGFPGMSMGLSQAPDGHFLGWTPGNRTRINPPGMAWRLWPGNDLVLQLHLTPTGKPEQVRPRIGLYFTDTPTTIRPYAIVLSTQAIDIPAGESDYVLRDHLTLPVPITIESVYPHAHYLCRTMEATATTPGGESFCLFRIDAWDFDWQDDYRFRDPVALPAGTEVAFEYHYDNSAANVANPHSPPQRVTFGQKSTDEMGTLTLTAILASDDDRLLLRAATAQRDIEKRPWDWGSWLQLGVALRQSQQVEPAIRALREALRLRSDYPEALCELGICLYMAKDPTAAEQALREAIRIDPDQSVARMHLGEILARDDRPRQAIEQFRLALVMHPNHSQLHNNLATALFIENELDEAAHHYQKALGLQPGYFNAQFNLGRVLARMGKAAEARQALMLANELRPGHPGVREALGELRR